MKDASGHIRLIAITGFMGAGKSSVGRSLGALLAWKFVDLDEQVERRAGLPIRDIFRTHGEPYFREIETECLHKVLKRATGTTVLALGGGTFVEQRNAELLRDRGAHIIFLECELEVLLQRCHVGPEPRSDSHRPLACDANGFRALYAQRLPQYRAADLTIRTDGKTVEQVAREIAATLQVTGRAARP